MTDLNAKIDALREACNYAAEGYEHLVTKTMPQQRKYLRNPDSIAKHDVEAEYASTQAKILRDAVPLIDALQARIAEVEREGWRPIESAPKGYDVLLFDLDGFQTIGNWEQFCQYNAPGYTHWMPLPAAPEPKP